MHEYPGCEDECVRECVCVCNGWTQDQNIIDSCDLCMLAVIGHSTAWSILRWPANRFGRCPWTRYQVKVNLMVCQPFLAKEASQKSRENFPPANLHGQLEGVEFSAVSARGLFFPFWNVGISTLKMLKEKFAWMKTNSASLTNSKNWRKFLIVSIEMQLKVRSKKRTCRLHSTHPIKPY